MGRYAAAHARGRRARGRCTCARLLGYPSPSHRNLPSLRAGGELRDEAINEMGRRLVTPPARLCSTARLASRGYIRRTSRKGPGVGLSRARGSESWPVALAASWAPGLRCWWLHPALSVFCFVSEVLSFFKSHSMSERRLFIGSLDNLKRKLLT